MRCSCHICDTYMAQSEGPEMGCVCPQCGYRCKACLGTDSVVNRETLMRLKDDAALMQEILSGLDEDDAPEDTDESADKWSDDQWTD